MVPSQNLPTTPLLEKLKQDKATREVQALERRKRYMVREAKENIGAVVDVITTDNDFERAEPSLLYHENEISPSECHFDFTVSNSKTVSVANSESKIRDELPTNNNSENSIVCHAESEALISKPLIRSCILEEHLYCKLSAKKDVGVQTDPTTNLQDACIQAVSAVDCVKPFTITGNLKTNKHLNTFTGLSSFQQLEAIEKCVNLILRSNVKHTIKKHSLMSVCDKIILTLIRLKNATNFEFLSRLFNVSGVTCKNYYNEMIPVLAAILKNANVWPSKEMILKNMPECFREYNDTRIVLDCTEVAVQQSGCQNCRIHTYSFYKGTETEIFNRRSSVRLYLVCF